MKRIQEFATACLAVGLAAAWTGRSSAATPVYDNLTLNATPSVNLYDAYYFYSGYTYVNSVRQTTWTLTPLGNLTGGVNNTINFSALEPGGDPSTFVYSLVGVYDLGNQLVTVGVNSAEAANLTATPVSFSSAFIGPYTEAVVATAVMNGDIVNLDRFFLSIPNYNAMTSPLGESGEFFNFSNASPGGTFTVSASPEPATLSVLGLGVMGLFFGRRRSTTR
jgi:PEP-CTERM motif